MTSVFWDSERAILADFLPRGGTINVQYYIGFLRDVFRIAIRKKNASGTATEFIVLHENACLHRVDLT
jgi:hypothetical protein